MSWLIVSYDLNFQSDKFVLCCECSVLGLRYDETDQHAAVCQNRHHREQHSQVHLFCNSADGQVNIYISQALKYIANHVAKGAQILVGGTADMAARGSTCSASGAVDEAGDDTASDEHKETATEPAAAPASVPAAGEESTTHSTASASSSSASASSAAPHSDSTGYSTDMDTSPPAESVAMDTVDVASAKEMVDDREEQAVGVETSAVNSSSVGEQTTAATDMLSQTHTVVTDVLNSIVTATAAVAVPHLQPTVLLSTYLDTSDTRSTSSTSSGSSNTNSATTLHALAEDCETLDEIVPPLLHIFGVSTLPEMVVAASAQARHLHQNYTVVFTETFGSIPLYTHHLAASTVLFNDIQTHTLSHINGKQ